MGVVQSSAIELHPQRSTFNINNLRRSTSHNRASVSQSWEFLGDQLITLNSICPIVNATEAEVITAQTISLGSRRHSMAVHVPPVN